MIKKLMLFGTVAFSLFMLTSCPAVFADEQAAAPSASKTLANLMTAFNGESNANARYLAFATKADEEGYRAAASLFRATARAEQAHFERHASVIKELGGTPAANIETPVVKSTKENLEEALKGENYENKVMYPEFLAQAEKDKVASAVDDFEDAMKAEGVHAQWYKQALGSLNAWKDQKKNFFVCPKCGNVLDDIKEDFCPICRSTTDKFYSLN